MEAECTEAQRRSAQWKDERAALQSELHAERRHVELERKHKEALRQQRAEYEAALRSLQLPPLRQRPEDIPLLTQHFIARHAERNSRNFKGISAQALEALAAWQWPGNVRQLRNTVERACYLAKNGIISPADLHIGGRAAAPIQRAAQEAGALPEELFSKPFKVAKQEVIDQFERAYLERIVARTDGNLSRAAGEAEITRYYLRELLKRLGMHKSNKPPAGEE